MATEEWEQARACVNGPGKPAVDPQWWDVDGTKADHLEAKAVCRRCPVRAKCAERVAADVLGGKPVSGLFAARIWDPRCGKTMSMDVDDWRKFRRGTLSGNPEFVPVERRCIGPKCTKVFLVNQHNKSKTACSHSCSAQAREKKRKRIARVKARNS